MAVMYFEKSSEHIPVSDNTNFEMQKFLKVMSWLGYLPISWVKPNDPEYEETKFKISLKKSLLIALIDVAIALLVVAYLPFWHLLNMEPGFDLFLLLKPEYYSRIFHGSSTSTLSYFTFIFYPVFFWWIYVKVGYGMANLNKLLKEPWFQLDAKTQVVNMVIFAVGLFLHGVNFINKFADGKSINTGFLFYFPTLTTYGITGFRMLMFKILFETLINSLLCGWTKKKPKIDFEGQIDHEEWEDTKQRIKSWIQVYHIIEETFGDFFLFSISTCVPIIILLVYMFLTLAMSNVPFNKSYPEYIAFGLMLTGFVMNTLQTVKQYHQAYETTTSLKKEILMTTAESFSEDQIVQQKKEILISILSSASPFNAKGYFQVGNSIITSVIGAATTYIVVLVQFNISEKSSCLPILEENNVNISALFDSL